MFLHRCRFAAAGNVDFLISIDYLCSFNCCCNFSNKSVLDSTVFIRFPSEGRMALLVEVKLKYLQMFK